MTLDIAHQLVKEGTFVIDVMRQPSIQCAFLGPCSNCEYATGLRSINCPDCYAFRLDITNCDKLLESYPELTI